MIEKPSFVTALVALVLPWKGGPVKSRARRIPKGWDFGSMPEDERYADWS